MAEQNHEASLYAYSPPTSLWSMIESQLPCNELEEVKSFLGESVIEQSRELHEEVEVLLEIWRECHQEAEEQQTTLMHNRLPEPPALRERLKAEIRFLVESIQEKSKRSGGDPDKILSRQNSQVLDYVLERSSYTGQSKASQCVRPMSAISNGRETPVSKEPLRTNRSERISIVDDVLGQNKNMTMETLESVTQHLREVLREEINFLLQDIEFLHNCIEAEANSQGTHEPTLTDLREQRNQLERELLTSSPNIRLLPKKQSSDNILRESSSQKWLERSTVPMSESSDLPKPVQSTPLASLQTLTLNAESALSNSKPHRPPLSSKTRPSRPLKGPVLALPATEMSSSIGELLQASLPTHVTIRTGSLPPSTKLVKVMSIPAKNRLPANTADDTQSLHPNPPESLNLPASLKSAPIHRPGSAQRFRNMVLECRDDK